MRVPIEMNLQFKYVLSNFNETIVLLQEIIDKEYYRKDYKENTSVLVYDKISYDEAVSVIPKIIERHLF